MQYVRETEHRQLYSLSFAVYLTELQRCDAVSDANHSFVAVQLV